MQAATRRLCSVCCQRQASYTCPRCHKVYCSTDCYRQHSQTCSEAFYREQATAQLKATKAGPEQTQHMLEVLQRLHEQQQAEVGVEGFEGSDGASSSSSDGGSDSDAEGAAVAVGPALKRLLKRAEREGAAFEVQPSDLTPELLQQLEALSLRGQLSHLVPIWEPWWESETGAALQLNAAGQRVVQDMQQLHQQAQQQSGGAGAAAAAGSGSSCRVLLGSGVGSERKAEGPSGVPSPPEQPLPSLQQLAGPTHRPSPLLPWQLLQLLVAYCAVMRLFNGEPEAEEGGWEAAQQLLLLAPPLVQAALAAAGSSSTGSKASGAPAPPQPQHQQQQQSQQQDTQQQQQQQQSHQQSQVGASIPPPDSVCGACLQLMDAAAAAAEGVAGDSSLQEQLAAAAAAISYGGGAALSAEQRSLLQVATADGLKLLQLGRSAVVLALTDTHRLLQGARESVKQQLQQSAGSSIIKAPAKHRQLLQQLKKCLQPAAQKAWYFVVWSNQQAPLAYQCLCQELAAEVQGQQAMAQQPTGVSLTGRPASSLPRVEPVPQQPVVVLAQAAAGSVSQASAATNLYELD